MKLIMPPDLLLFGLVNSYSWLNVLVFSWAGGFFLGDRERFNISLHMAKTQTRYITKDLRKNHRGIILHPNYLI